MKLKQYVKNSFLYPWLARLRYFLHRYIRNRQFRSYSLAPGVQINQFGTKISFFGYYNISPSNQVGDILFLEVEQEASRASMIEQASIMLRISSGETRQIARTVSWNWQQGCMLQWLPGSNGNILFNDYDPAADRYIAKVVDISGDPVARYDIPVNNISKCGSFALSLNYDRLAKMRPDYGYFNKKDQTLPPDDQDGIWYLDLKTGDYKLIITLESLKNLYYTPTMDGADHKVNHIDINPEGSRFMFLHRWVGPQGRYMRLITANPDGTDLCILNGDAMTSHCCWMNNDEILSFCDYKEERGYFKFIDRTQNVSIFSSEMPKVDGHPSISPNGEWIITDSYPDKARMSYLYLYSIKNDQVVKLGRFHQSLSYKGEMRVDLHPKWGIDSKTIYFESAHCQFRKLYVILYF
jgi:hypothetical protein